ncbi:putative ribosomal protein L11 methyltransferase (PrmA) [Lyophyllum shimeji]|uniref:Arsenite methyltransferase n=1 Tax=Lyophyllum shimeji TaxID=47721 RepID=A0A9P3USE4_LYOSH|nr:putative ribosomal protein L11 methyltransferase (PrmA) [Lyophyllum shimeji]
MSNVTETDIVAAVEKAYSDKAKFRSSEANATEAAQSVGYTQQELETVPATANLGVGCGSPVAAANIKEGEIVVDLGSGGGIDVLLAAAKVGPRGQAIGLDMSGEMIALSRRNAKEKGLKAPSVAFVQVSLAEPLPIASNTVDCVLSNCVVNLLPEGGKQALFNQVYRILKPGGRVVLDDILAKRPLSDEIRNDLTSYINCIAGSIQIEEYKALLQTAGFSDVHFLETKNDLTKVCSGMNSSCCSTSKSTLTFDVNEWVASYQITALKSRDTLESTDSPPTSALLRWWDAYPKVKSSPALISSEELAALMLETRPSGPQHDLAVIDVRRDDHAGGHVRGSDNWPAQTFHDDLPAFLEKYRHTSHVIFYCGSSSGRGPRCAGWYQDYLDETGTTTSTAYVLRGGVKAWLAKYGNDDRLVDKD